jgi:type II secretory pathway component PulF
MAVYTYFGKTKNGTDAKGSVSADSPRQARDQLRARGIEVQRLTDSSASGKNKFAWSFGTTSLQSQWADAAQELSMLLRAGITLLESLDTLAKQQTGRFRVVLMSVRDRVAAGVSLADAMAERPDVFDRASIHLVEVGENAGNLEHVLEQLATFKLRMAETKDQVISTLIYPAFLVLFGIGAAIFLMTVVMPTLLENLQETLTVLPWPTRVVQSFSGFLVTYGWLLVLALIAALTLFWVYIRSEAGQLVWHRFLLKLPFLGPMLVKQGVARIAMIVGTLLRSGIVLTNAFDLAGKSTSNRVLRSALEECGQRMGAGENVAEALEKAGVFPPLAVRVFAVGQESGQLEEMLERLALDYDRQVSTLSKRFTSLLEPVLIVVLAVFVGFLLIATILPILEAGNVAQ